MINNVIISISFSLGLRWKSESVRRAIFNWKYLNLYINSNLYIYIYIIIEQPGSSLDHHWPFLRLFVKLYNLTKNVFVERMY